MSTFAYQSISLIDSFHLLLSTSILNVLMLFWQVFATPSKPARRNTRKKSSSISDLSCKEAVSHQVFDMLLERSLQSLHYQDFFMPFFCSDFSLLIISNNNNNIILIIIIIIIIIIIVLRIKMAIKNLILLHGRCKKQYCGRVNR